LRLLLDSHILLWWPAASPKLGSRARDLIGAADAELYMSAVSWWELGLKRALGKLDANLSEVRRMLERRDVTALSVTLEHGEAAAALPIKHRDPFDHMLVAQASVEGLQLLTRDKYLAPYGSSVLCV
jgi:PIN domain nuclease of toxin-antitoxin system